MTPTPRQDPASTRSLPSHAARRLASFGLGPLAGVLATAALVLAATLRAFDEPRVAVAPLTGLLVLAGLPLLRSTARVIAPTRPGVLLGLIAAAMAPVLGAAALWALGMPIVQSGSRCGTGDIGLVILAPAMLIGASTVGAACGTALLARWSARVESALRATTWVAIAACALLAAAATYSAATRPDPDHYVASLPVVGRMVPASVRAVEVTRLGPDLLLTRGLMPSSFESRAPLLAFEHGAHQPVLVAIRTWRAITVRAEGRGLYTLEDEGAPSHAWAAYSPVDNRLVSVSAPSRLWSRAAPPRGWILGAWAGVALALGLIASGARRRSSLLARRDAWQAGELGDDGWITFRDGAAPRRAPDAAVAPGPVVVVPRGAAAPPATFRTDGGLAEIELFAGTLDELAARERAGDTSRYAVALASVALLGSALAATLLPLLGWGR